MLRMRALRPLILALGAISVGACAIEGASPGPGSSNGDGIFTVVVSPVLAVGPNRFIYSVIDAADNRPMGLPDRPSTVRFLPPGEDGPNGPDGSAIEVQADFIWAIDEVSGLYVARVSFERSGEWRADIEVSGSDIGRTTSEARFTVVAARPGVGVGSAAPPVDNPTATDVGGNLRLLTTDVAPEPRFYAHSVAELLAEHVPFVLAFASPGFCTTGTCGPAVERLKSASRTFPSVAFIQIESYAEHVVNGRLQPLLDAAGNLQESAAFAAYGLPTETAVVVVDASGTIRDIFDVTVGAGEVQASLRSLGVEGGT
ncbi:MAG TPA: hypothetical protein VL691_15835 [Vicinamibacteria bacterium]|nr:hypothetical protein [Vicinamibacteria bacterium]